MHAEVVVLLDGMVDLVVMAVVLVSLDLQELDRLVVMVVNLYLQDS